MADSKVAEPRVGSTSPPPHCAICLGTCINKCRANSCMHEFCYSCLLEWSRIKAECPLCKQEFKSILHNIKSINEFDVHIVENIPVDNNRFLENASLIYLPPATPPIHHYQFRTTITVDPSGEHAIQQMLLHHPLLIGGYNHDRYAQRRRGARGETSTTFRRSVYAENLWVYAPPDVTGRYRDVSPTFYRSNPASRTRLVPWLNRELNALLNENTQYVMRLVDIILEHLLRYHICSYTFRSILYEYLGNKTDHFIHEFYNFMRSPYDMIGYDRHVVYRERHEASPTRFIDEVDISDYDSDVILVSDTNNNQGQSDPVVIDLVETDSDEPIIVSEERSQPRPEEENRKPLLPLKLRIKNRRKTKERKKAKKRHHRQATTNSSTSSSPSSNDSSTEESSECDHKRHKKKPKKEKKRRRDSYYVEKNSDNEDDIPLATFARKKKSKHTKHRVPGVKKEKRRKHEEEQEQDSSSSDESLYSGHKQYVKSRGKEARGEDRHKAGPSSGRLRNTLKKEASTNLWYSRPSAFDSDSSDS